MMILLVFGTWLGLGLLFTSQSKYVGYGENTKDMWQVFGWLILLCVIFGPFLPILLHIVSTINNNEK